MNTTSHNRKNRKNRLQKRIQVLQTERDELNAKLLEYESEIAGQTEHFENAEREYKKKIHSLELKLQFKRHEETPILRKRITNWIFFGVACSIYPLIMNILFIWILGYNITLSDIISDFLLVLFAVSINLISILYDSIDRGPLFRIIHMFLMVFATISLELSIFLSSDSVLLEPRQDRISMIFLFTFISLIIVTILGIITIIWQAKK